MLVVFKKFFDFYRKYSFLFLIFSFVLFLFFIYLFNYSFYVFYDVERYEDDVLTEKDLVLPDQFNGQNKKLYVYKLKLKKNIFNKSWFKFIGDDEIKYININGTKVNEKKSKHRGKFNDWRKGIIINLENYLTEEVNSVEVGVFNDHYMTGLKVTSVYYNTYYTLFKILIYLFLILFLMLLLDIAFKFNKTTIIILILGLFIRLIYISVTPFNSRSHDQDNHVSYIDYIIENKKIPDPQTGWSFFHPPLYYVLSSLTVLSLGPLDLIHTVDTKPIFLQYQSLIIFFLYLAFAIKILIYLFEKFWKQYHPEIELFHSQTFIAKLMNSTLNKDTIFALLVSLFVFWPSSIVHSVRVGNDCLLYLFYTISLLFLIKWNDTLKRKDFIISLVFACLSLLTKSNSLLLFFIIGIVICVKFFQQVSLKSLRTFFIRGFILFIVFTFSFLISSRINPFGSKKNHLLGNEQARTYTAGLNVGNKAGNYLWFDVKTFIEEPFMNPWVDRQGRQYFWNYILKTSLFGEFQYPSILLENVGSIISFIFLFLLVVLFFGFFQLEISLLKSNYIVFLNFFVLIMGSAMFRMNLPISPSNDFRYIHMSLISFVFFIMITLILILQKKRLRLFTIGYLSVILFILFSAFFYSALFFVTM